MFSSDNNQLTGAIFIDLSKAFDLVDHYLLLDKLYSIGFSQNALLWFNSYRHTRRQCVAIQGSHSDYLIVDKGIWPTPFFQGGGLLGKIVHAMDAQNPLHLMAVV